MPLRAKRHCPCGALDCQLHSPQRLRQQREAKRLGPRKRGYTTTWDKYSLAYLREHPLCLDPFGFHDGAPIPAQVTDHKVPHRGDMRLFWDPNNHQPLCKRCHDRKTATEDGGFGNARASATKSEG